MKIKATKLIELIILAIALPLVNGCFTILTIEQPSTATTGEKISVYLEVRTEDTDQNPHYGILGLLIPKNWAVDSVYYSGDFGPDYCTYLHPDSSDGDPGGKVDYWYDSLEVHFPSGDDLHWVVYQANTPYSSDLDTGYVDVFIEMIVGGTPGTYNIGYFVTNAALDFSDSTWYSVSLDNPIEITSSTAINNEDGSKSVPGRFHLTQNYPNPFNPKTTIIYELPVAGVTILKLYNLLGEEVSTLVNRYESAGSHRVIVDASNLKSGIYYYRIQTSDFSATKKMLFVK